MSKQLHYIISAFLLLVVFAGVFLVVTKIPVQQSAPGESIISTVPESTLVLPGSAAKGKALFQSKCNSCHTIFKSGTGPALADLEDRHKWANKEELYKWIKNPAAYMKNDVYTQQLKGQYGSMMTGFPDMANEDIDAIMEYIRNASQPVNIPMPVANR